MAKHQRLRPLGILALLAAIAYVIAPYDCDTAWYGFIDDFFVFLGGYTFFMSTRQVAEKPKQMLRLIAAVTFIVGMLSLIALIFLC